jgi:hypothetical protein
MVSPDPARYFNSTCFRHLNVQDGNVGLMFQDKAASDIAIFGFCDYANIRRPFQNLANAGPNDSVIISQENPNLLTHATKSKSALRNFSSI